MCAVYGGTYVLRRAPAYLLFDPAQQGKLDGMICTEGQRFSSPVIVCAQEYLPPSLVAPDASPSTASTSGGSDAGPGQTSKWSNTVGPEAEAGPEAGAEGGEVRRGICVTSGYAGAEGVVLSVFPPGSCGNSCAIRVQQVDASSQATPQGSGKVVWHLWASEAGPCDLRLAVALLRRLAPHVAVHWVAYYTSVARPPLRHWSGAAARSEGGHSGDRAADVDSSDAIEAARNLFFEICGQAAEFLPAMPEPQEHEGDDEERAGVDLDQPADAAERVGGWDAAPEEEQALKGDAVGGGGEGGGEGEGSGEGQGGGEGAKGV
ncbi:hypothetical protein T484DRAFT_1808989 [Baffinella frigidus]|nr:hypothetical protein T484DRAFT_1808989 [Cryptophyta sp. CCMP2293]